VLVFDPGSTRHHDLVEMRFEARSRWMAVAVQVVRSSLINRYGTGNAHASSRRTVMVLLAVAVALSIMALTAGAVAFSGVEARVAAPARALCAVLLLAALILLAILALGHTPAFAT
jgi:hypothetical protein